MEPHVFISYAHEDGDLVERITEILEELNVPYFQDRKAIQWGDAITAAVRGGLARASAVIVVISKASLRSHWVPFEIGHAIALGKDVLPFVTNPDLRIPNYVHDLNYITDLSALRQHFANVRASGNFGKHGPGRNAPRKSVDLRIGLSSKAYHPIEATIKQLQQIANRIMPDTRARLQFSVEHVSYETARQQFQTSHSYDIIMIDDPWVPAYAEHVHALNEEPALARYLEERGLSMEDLFGTVFIKSLREGCTYEGRLLGLPIVGNVQLLIHRTDAYRLLEANAPAEALRQQPLNLRAFEDVSSAAKEKHLLPVLIRNMVDNDIVEIFWELLRANGHSETVRDGVVHIDRGKARAARQWISDHTVSKNFVDFHALLLAEVPTVLTAVGWPAWIASDLSTPQAPRLGTLAFQRIAPKPVMGIWLLALPRHPLDPEVRDYALRVVLALTADSQFQFLLAQAGNVPVLEDFAYTEQLRHVPFWERNYFTIRDALADSLPRPRTKLWQTMETEIGKQLRQGDFNNVEGLVVYD